jgi:hypothetical protein
MLCSSRLLKLYTYYCNVYFFFCEKRKSRFSFEKVCNGYDTSSRTCLLATAGWLVCMIRYGTVRTTDGYHTNKG